MKKEFYMAWKFGHASELEAEDLAGEHYEPFRLYRVGPIYRVWATFYSDVGDEHEANWFFGDEETAREFFEFVKAEIPPKPWERGETGDGNND